MRNSHLVTITMCFLIGTSVYADDPGREGPNPIQVLFETSVFASAKVYEAGRYSRQAWAFSRILRFDRAASRAVFEFIYVNSRTQAGRMYALAGLWEVDRERYFELVNKRPKEDQTVETLIGSVRAEVVFQTLLNWIESGKMRVLLSVPPEVQYAETVEG